MTSHPIFVINEFHNFEKMKRNVIEYLGVSNADN